MLYLSYADRRKYNNAYQINFTRVHSSKDVKIIFLSIATKQKKKKRIDLVHVDRQTKNTSFQVASRGRDEDEREREREKRRKGEAVIPRKEKIVDIFIVYKVHVYARNCLPVRSLSPLGEVGRPLGERSRGRRPPLSRYLSRPESSPAPPPSVDIASSDRFRDRSGELSHKISPDLGWNKNGIRDGYL